MKKFYEFIYICMCKVLIWYDKTPYTQRKRQKEYNDRMNALVMSTLNQMTDH